MEVLNLYRRRFSSKRDILNFINIRDAKESDDKDLGDLLVETFRDTNAEKNQKSTMNSEREHELRNTGYRRENALVRVVELGNMLVGTYTLSKPGAKTNTSWIEDSCYFSTLAVSKTLHGLNIGKMLVLEALVTSLDSTSKHMTLSVEKYAPGLQQFYKNMGFYYDPRGDKISCGMEILGNTCDLCVVKTNNLLKAI